MLLYVALVILLMQKTHFWDASLTKDTVLWLLGTAFVLLVRANEASQDEHFFKKLLLDSLKLILLLEFIINLYTFSFWVEMILIPSLTFIGTLAIVAETKKEYMPARKVLDFLLVMLGFTLIAFALTRLFSDSSSFANTDSLRSFLLPPLLTLAYLPFIFAFALYMTYDGLFRRMDIFMEGDKALAKFAKIQIVALCHLRLKRVSVFWTENIHKLTAVKNKDEMRSIVREFKRKGQ